jgi:hypothetical protein
MDSLRQFEQRSFKEQLEALDRLRNENNSKALELIGMKDKRLTYQEARIEALERENGRLNKQNTELQIEILNLQYLLKNAENNNDR